jgi:uncharacterized membrane protein
LTSVWATLLLALALLSLLLALIARPDGLLLAFGVEPHWSVPLSWWSLVANAGNYVVIGGFFLGEYFYRRRRFPQQPYRGFMDFMQRIARIDPSFWRSR